MTVGWGRCDNCINCDIPSDKKAREAYCTAKWGMVRFGFGMIKCDKYKPRRKKHGH